MQSRKVTLTNIRNNFTLKAVTEYNLLKCFDILSVGDIEKLVKKQKDANDPILYHVTSEELYSKIEELHTAQGHGGKNKLMATYANITAEAVKIYISICEECQCLHTNKTT